MDFKINHVENLKIAYVGGGSRGWAWGLMSDLAKANDISGKVYLYDIDFEAAKHNEIIGNKFNDAEGANSRWDYIASETLEETLTDADFVVISILPGTFDEMQSDVHAPEKYGIYQTVGDSTGPGGIIRALRTLPMYEVIANGIKDYCPKAWVINYTNPMTLCTAQLYKTFPEIKAFGCCHEVFGTQKLLCDIVKEKLGVEKPTKDDIDINVVGINHFTWITKAHYKNIDLYPIYKEICDEYAKTGYLNGTKATNLNKYFNSMEKVKMDLFLRTGVMAAAGDRHLSEFCPGKWYLESPERVSEMCFELTPVSWRKEDLKDRLEKSARLVNGEENVKITNTGEEGVNQIRALLGLENLVTNVNIPNCGQIPNLPLGAVVETNAYFTGDSVTPITAGEVPPAACQLVSKIANEQLLVLRAVEDRSLEEAFAAFSADPLVTCSLSDARKLFDEMVKNTSKYLKMYK